MKETLVLTDKPEKPLFFKNVIFNARNRLGGLIMSIIIPPSLTHLMTDVELEEKPSNTEFYLYGWFEKHKFSIYIDETLNDDIYLICNYKNMKFHIIGG